MYVPVVNTLLIGSYLPVLVLSTSQVNVQSLLLNPSLVALKVTSWPYATVAGWVIVIDRPALFTETVNTLEYTVTPAISTASLYEPTPTSFEIGLVELSVFQVELKVLQVWVDAS